MVSSTAFFVGTFAATMSTASASAGSASASGGSEFDWGTMTQAYAYSGDTANTIKSFDSNYYMALVGEKGYDRPVVHQKIEKPTIGLSSMEKVTAMTAVSKRSSIRAQLVHVLRSQVQIEAMYGHKKEKLYMAASSIYNFISKLLQQACSIAINNDHIWKAQMHCFTAYHKLLEIYSMYQQIKDVIFALEHGMMVHTESLKICGPGAANPEHFVAHNTENGGYLQNSYLVAATTRACWDTLQVQLQATTVWYSTEMVSMDSSQDQAQACIYKTLTTLGCMTAGVQEAILDLAITVEHDQKVAYGFAKYTAASLNDNSHPDDESTTMMPMTTTGGMNATTAGASFMEVEDDVRPTLRDIRMPGAVAGAISM